MTGSGALQVLVVEDSALVCDRIAEIVGSVPGVEMSARVDCEADALSVLERDRIDIVILDLQLRSGTGFGVLRRLRGRSDPPVVVVFTNFAVPTYRERARNLGAEYFLDKLLDLEKLPKVLAGLARPDA
jgi:two-component system OmpR family response regulator